MKDSGFKRELGLVDLTFASLGGIIGSGWIFASLYASQAAGPAAIISWIVGGVAVLLIGLVYTELGGMLPETGGIARYPQYSHGSLVSWLMGWAAWLTYVTVPPAEALAMVQVLSGHIGGLYTPGGVVSFTGFLLAALFTVMFFGINYFGVTWFRRVNTSVTWVKLVIPAGTALILIITAAHFGNLSNAAAGGFMPFKISGALTAVGTSGILFSLLGFRQAIDMAGEAKNPQRDVPRAVILAIVIGLAVYLLLQIALLVGIPPADLAKYGWAGISKDTLFGSLPFAGIASIFGLSWLGVLLNIDGFISPGGTGVVYTASTSRLVFALAENGYLPPGLKKLHPKFAVPTLALWINLVAGIVALGPFPAWSKIIGFVSITGFFAYAIGPVALMVLRRTAANLPRPVKLGNAGIISLLAFVIGSMIIYWASWTYNVYALGAIFIGVVIYAIMYFSGRAHAKEIKSGIWLVAYLIAMGLVSYLGASTFAGTNLLPAPWDTVVIVIMAVIFYYWGIHSGIETDSVLEAIANTSTQAGD